MKKYSKGITLVALVITIIILILLAGIAIATLGGEDGLIAKVKQSKEKYSISEAKEKLELSISNLQIEQEGKGESLKKEDLSKIDGEEIDVRDTSNFPVKVICNNYEFNIDSNFSVSYVGITNETIITYTMEPEGYTNKNEVKILIKIKNSKGIKSVEYPNDNDKLLAKGQTEIGFDYKVTANGTYTFKIVDNDNKETIKDIVIDKIDTVEPKDFTPSVEDIKSTSFTIVANVEDGDATDTSTKSGIERYEYFVKEKSSKDYIKYETGNNKYTIEALEPGTEYEFYVIAYDKANNSKASEINTQMTKVGPKDIYIDSVKGNDGSGDGSETRPYATLQKITKNGLIKNNIIYNIYLQAGTYYLPNWYQFIELNNNQELNLYGKKQETILQLPYEGIGSNVGSGGTTNYSINFYRMIIELNNTNRNNYWCCRNQISFNNVVFNMKVNVSISTFYTTKVEINNSISICKGVVMRSDNPKTFLTNCYGSFVSGYATNQSQWDYQTNYITLIPQVDSITYRITEDESKWKNIGTGTNPDGSQANLGVYGGEYSWEN